MPSELLDVFLFVFGLIVGSFLNVCIHRFPREESIVSPGSHCPACGKPVAWYDNIPLVSYLILGRKCRHCGIKISSRYFFIELITGIAFLASVRFFGWTGQAAASACFLAILLGISATDMEHQIIPDEFSLGGLALGFCFSAAFPVLHRETEILRSILMSAIGALAGGGAIYLTGVFGEFVFKKESMGGGDVKLMAMMGAFLGWQGVLLVYFLSPLLALPLGVYVKFRKKEDYIPYGPFLALSGVVVLFFGDYLLRNLIF